MDLDIENYDLYDLLHLFKIPIDFDETDLKQAKTMVLKTHPDKSHLDPAIFRFYSSAYKRVYALWEFKKKGDINKNKDEVNTEYNSYEMNETEKRTLLDSYFQEKKGLKDKGAFNQWFNEQFEKNRVSSEKEEKGYEKWLRSTDDDKNTLKANNISTMNQEIDKRKKEIRSLIVHQEVRDIPLSSLASYDLSESAPTSFDSDLFSSLPFQDLQKAHTETVIPVTIEDYKQREKFKSVNEYHQFRNQQDIRPLSEMESEAFFRNKERNDEEMSTKTAYYLAKQTEIAQNKQSIFWSGIQRIENM
jgi:hypothetical protein